MKNDVSIIIPVFNTRELIARIFPVVIKTKENARNRIIEIIVVDDASTDGSYEFIKKNFPEIRLIKHKINRGFSASINTGVRSARGKLLALLNSDVIPDKNFLTYVVKHFEEQEVFAVSLHEKGFSWAKGYFKEGFIEHAPGKLKDEAHETFWVNGGSGVFRRDYWMKLGGLDERLLSPFYWEDIDICYRAAKRGLINVWEPNSKIIHEHESTIKKLPQNYVNNIRERNQLLFIWKNITSPNLFRKHILGLIQRVIRHPGYIKIVLMALGKIRFIIKARKKEKKESKISDEAIFAKFKD